MVAPERSPQIEPPQHGAAANGSKFEVTAQLLNIEPGLYTVEVLAPRAFRGASGMIVPCIRLDPIYDSGDARAFVSTLADSAFIQPGNHVTYLRVEGSNASVLLTIYKLTGGMEAPELRISLVQPGREDTSATTAFAAQASEMLTLLAHVARAGDVAVGGGVWAGRLGGGVAIEGFAVTPGGAIKPDDIEYQAILGSDWATPWHSAGDFCGSRGLSLPILGARVRLRGEAAKSYSVNYWGNFIGVGEIGPIADGAVCAAAGAPLEAFRVVLNRRVTQKTATVLKRLASEMIAGTKGTPQTLVRAAAAGTPAKPQNQTAKVGKVTTLTSIRSKLGRK
jgi:hypothetical protein